jgi:hypothetical protein
LPILFSPVYFSRPRKATFETAVRAAEHSTFLAPPDRNLAAAWARELHRALSGKYSACTPSTCWHTNDFLCGSSTHFEYLEGCHTHASASYKLIAGECSCNNSADLGRPTDSNSRLLNKELAHGYQPWGDGVGQNRFCLRAR